LARVESPLDRKVKKLLVQRFPPPAKVDIDDHDGIVGVVTSDQFAKMDTIDRQNLIGKIIEKELSREERRRVQVIVAVTPDEGRGYLAGEE
jgi:hypothetical protein